MKINSPVERRASSPVGVARDQTSGKAELSGANADVERMPRASGLEGRGRPSLHRQRKTKGAISAPFALPIWLT